MKTVQEMFNDWYSRNADKKIKRTPRKDTRPQVYMPNLKGNPVLPVIAEYIGNKVKTVSGDIWYVVRAPEGAPYDFICVE